MFRGREMEHIELGMDLVKQAIKDLSGVGKADDQPKLNGRFIIVSLSPLPKIKDLCGLIHLKIWRRKSQMTHLKILRKIPEKRKQKLSRGSSL